MDDSQRYLISTPFRKGGPQGRRGHRHDHRHAGHDSRHRPRPFGFIHILRAAKKTKQLDLLLGAIREKYRGMGLDVMMGAKTLISAHEAGYEFIDTHHELESNVKVRGEMERMGGKIYKRYRVFQKPF
jgi:hypothetical protein